MSAFPFLARLDDAGAEPVTVIGIEYLAETTVATIITRDGRLRICPMDGLRVTDVRLLPAPIEATEPVPPHDHEWTPAEPVYNTLGNRVVATRRRCLVTGCNEVAIVPTGGQR